MNFLNVESCTVRTEQFEIFHQIIPNPPFSFLAARIFKYCRMFDKRHVTTTFDQTPESPRMTVVIL